MVVAVLDACVLFPASVRDTLLRTAAADLYQLRWTDLILEEVKRNLEGKGNLTQAQTQHLLDEMNRAFPDALLNDEYQNLIDTMKNHPKDRHVLAAAVACKAQMIITFNLRDFPKSALTPHHVIAQSPDAFLLGLLATDVESILSIVESQAHHLRKPQKTTADVVKSLKIHTPKFAAAIEKAFQQQENEG